jgi:hypothetical protein
MREFCNWEHHGPGPWEATGPGSKVLFDPSVHSFGLTVCPRVERARKVLLYPQVLAHRAGKLRRESGVSVRDDAAGESKEGEDVLHVQACRFGPVDCFETGDKTCGF